MGVLLADDALHLGVDHLLRVLGGLGGAGQQRALRVGRDHGDRPEGAAHAPASDHAAGDRGQLLDVGLGAGREVAEHDLLGDAAAEGDADPPEQVLLVVVELVEVGCREGHAERLAARDDRDLAHRVRAGGQHADDRVPGLVVGGAPAVVLGHHDLARGAELDLLERLGEVG